MRQFAPDFDDTPTTEVPNFRRRAQKILHMLIGADISPEDYIEKLELIETALMRTYQEGNQSASPPRATTVPTLRPRKSTYPGIGPPSVHPPKDLDIDWSDLDDS